MSVEVEQTKCSKDLFDSKMLHTTFLPYGTHLI